MSTDGHLTLLNALEGLKEGTVIGNQQISLRKQKHGQSQAVTRRHLLLKNSRNASVLGSPDVVFESKRMVCESRSMVSRKKASTFVTKVLLLGNPEDVCEPKRTVSQ